MYLPALQRQDCPRQPGENTYNLQPVNRATRGGKEFRDSGEAAEAARLCDMAGEGGGGRKKNQLTNTAR